MTVISPYTVPHILCDYSRGERAQVTYDPGFGYKVVIRDFVHGREKRYDRFIYKFNRPSKRFESFDITYTGYDIHFNVSKDDRELVDSILNGDTVYASFQADGLSQYFERQLTSIKKDLKSVMNDVALHKNEHDLVNETISDINRHITQLEKSIKTLRKHSVAVDKFNKNIWPLPLSWWEDDPK